jgi:hypothetical protein
MTRTWRGGTPYSRRQGRASRADRAADAIVVVFATPVRVVLVIRVALLECSIGVKKTAVVRQAAGPASRDGSPSCCVVRRGDAGVRVAAAHSMNSANGAGLTRRTSRGRRRRCSH